MAGNRAIYSGSDIRGNGANVTNDTLKKCTSLLQDIGKAAEKRVEHMENVFAQSGLNVEDLRKLVRGNCEKKSDIREELHEFLVENVCAQVGTLMHNLTEKVPTTDVEKNYNKLFDELQCSDSNSVAESCDLGEFTRVQLSTTERAEGMKIVNDISELGEMVSKIGEMEKCNEELRNELFHDKITGNFMTNISDLKKAIQELKQKVQIQEALKRKHE